MFKEPFDIDDIVKTCPKLESGLNLSFNGLRACTRGALMPPLFCSEEDIKNGLVTKEFIIEKRKEYIRMLNDDHSEMDCKKCLMAREKKYGDISFSRLGHVDLQHYSVCNLRCTYCAYTQADAHLMPTYDALSVLELFSEDSIEWNAHIDFAGGEPTLLNNLEEYLEFFKKRRIRVLMYTNGVVYHQAIYDGLADGSIYLVTTSVDAGTPKTYNELRGRNEYLKVLENLSRYAVAGSKGKGMLAVKYIFCQTNCSDDDVSGFAYAMLALRPQQVWLTFDFVPLLQNQKDYDYTNQINAYAKLYLLLKKHGIEAFHYYKEAIATVSTEGRDIMNRILDAIEKQNSTAKANIPDLIFKNHRTNEYPLTIKLSKFSLNPFKISSNGEAQTKFSLEGKRVLLIPACPITQNLLTEDAIKAAEWIGFVDRNPIQQGKTIDGKTIYSYEAIASLNVDIILISPPEKHRSEILNTVGRYAPKEAFIAELEATC